MTNFDKFRRNTYIVMGVVTSFIIPFIIDIIKEKASSKGTAVIIGTGIAIIILLLVSFILEDLIDKNQKLRKFISPTTFIEGFWYDITKSQGNFVHIVILFIEYDQGKYKISGETFNKTQQVAIFNSLTSVNFSNNDLIFQTEGNYNQKSTFKSMDSFKFNTPPKNSMPSSYQGFYIDYTSLTLTQVAIGGCRISDEALANNNFFKSMSDKLGFVKKLASEGKI